MSLPHTVALALHALTRILQTSKDEKILLRTAATVLRYHQALSKNPAAAAAALLTSASREPAAPTEPEVTPDAGTFPASSTPVTYTAADGPGDEAVHIDAPSTLAASTRTRPARSAGDLLAFAQKIERRVDALLAAPAAG